MVENVQPILPVCSPAASRIFEAMQERVPTTRDARNRAAVRHRGNRSTTAFEEDQRTRDSPRPAGHAHTVGMDTVHSAAKLLAKAEEARIVAQLMQDAECRRMLLAIAYGYDMMAAHSAYLAELLEKRENSAPLA